MRVKNDVSRFVWNSLAAATASGQAKLASGTASPDVETLFSRRDSMSDRLILNLLLQGARVHQTCHPCDLVRLPMSSSPLKARTKLRRRTCML